MLEHFTPARCTKGQIPDASWGLIGLNALGYARKHKAVSCLPHFLNLLFMDVLRLARFSFVLNEVRCHAHAGS